MIDELCRVVVDRAPNALLVVSDDGRILLANAHVEELFGWARDQLVGQPVEVLVPERSRATHVALNSRFRDAPSVRAMGAGRDLTGVRRDGVEVPIEIALTPIEANGSRCVLASIIDIRWRKELEAQLRRTLAEKETLLREIHHRVKNNLQLVSSLLQLHHGSITDPRPLAVFKEAQRRVRAMALIHEKLYQSPSLSEVAAEDYLKGLVGLVVRANARPECHVITEVHADPMMLSVDLAQPLGLIVTELVSNGFKHAFPDGRSGQVVVELRREPPSTLCVVVRDDGVGLPVEFVPEQATSLGLKLVRYMLEQLGASMVVGDGPGACFEVRCPAPTDSNEVTSSGSARGPSSTST